MLTARLHVLTLFLIPTLAPAQEFDRPIQGKVQAGVHTLKLGPDAAYTLRLEHKPYTQHVERPNTLQVPLVLGAALRGPQDQLFSPAKAGDYRVVIHSANSGANAGPEPYTLALSKSPLSPKPILEEKGELKPGPRNPSEFKAKSGHLYVIECAYEAANARPILNLSEVTMRGKVRVLKQLAQSMSEIPVARFVHRAAADGTLGVTHQTALGFDAKSKVFTLRVWESEKPGPGEAVGEAVKGVTANGSHKFRFGPDALYFAALKTDRGPLKPELSKGVPRDWKDAPGGVGFYHGTLTEEDVWLNVSPVHYDPKLTGGEHDYTLTVKRLPLAAKPLLEVKGETTAADPTYADAHYKLHPVELKAGRWYAIDMLQGQKKLTLYPFLEDLSRPATGSFRTIVDQASAGAESPGARIVFRPVKDGKYGVMAKGLRRSDLGPYTVVVREAVEK
jgi:hypothetical protein